MTTRSHAVWRMYGSFARELVRAEHDPIRVEGIQPTGANSCVERLCLENGRRQVKLVGKFLAPLFTEVRRNDYEQSAMSFRPLLRQQQAGFYRFAQTHFVREDRALGEWGFKCEECGFDLVRIQVDLRIGKCPRQLFNAVRREPEDEFVSEEFGVVRRHQMQHGSG